PGIAAVELEYSTIVGEREWREVGTLHVQPAATVDLPRGTDIVHGLELTVRGVEPSLHGASLELSVGGGVRDRWAASADPHLWSGSVPEAESLEVVVFATDVKLTLWSGSVLVYGGIEFDPRASRTVTAADGSLEAELAFVGPSGWDRTIVEKSLLA